VDAAYVVQLAGDPLRAIRRQMPEQIGARGITSRIQAPAFAFLDYPRRENRSNAGVKQPCPVSGELAFRFQPAARHEGIEQFAGPLATECPATTDRMDQITRDDPLAALLV
jgi:hypothetical protein